MPVITAGVLVGHEDTTLKWYIMLPVVIAGVVIGDGVLYAIGRFWGRRLLNLAWVQRHFVPPEKRAEIEQNFATRGIMVLLGARLLPGIRTPDLHHGRRAARAVRPLPARRRDLRHPEGERALLALVHAHRSGAGIFNRINAYEPLVVGHLLPAIAGALLYKYVFARHVSTGEPPHVPKIIAKPAGAIGHAVESAVEKVTGRHQLADGNGEKTESGNGEAGLTEMTPSSTTASGTAPPAGCTTSRAFRPSADGASRHTSPFRTRTGPVPPAR